MEDFFDVSEVLYQKFLLDIYRHCDKFDFVDIPVSEKERMAAEMVGFVGKVIKSLESKKPLIKIEKNDAKSMKKISQIVSQRVKSDKFAESVINYYISTKKLKQNEMESYLTMAAIAVVSKGKKVDMKIIEEKIANGKPFVFRVASLLSPAVLLHEKLFVKTSSAKWESENMVLSEKTDVSFAKYID